MEILQGVWEVIVSIFTNSGYAYFFTADGGYKNAIMLLVAFVFLYLGIKKGFEPLLMVPIAFGMLLANIPEANLAVQYHEKGRHQGLTIDEREKRRERQPAGDLHGVEFGGVGQHDGDHAHALEHVEHADGVDGAGSGAFHEKGPSLRRPETCDQQAHTVKNDPFIRI